MEEIYVDKNDELVMKLLHYFITEQGYNPIILKGAKDEIWLENLNNDYKIIRISSGYIHNNEQFEFDVFRTKQITKKIKRKTLSFKMNVLNIMINLGDSVTSDDYIHLDNIDSINIKKIDDINKYKFVIETFPTITNDIDLKEKGTDLFFKVSTDIAKKNNEETLKAEDVFKEKKPVITSILLSINLIVFISMYLFGNGSYDVNTLLRFGANNGLLIKAGEYYRLITSIFIHIGLIHLLCNMYALYIIGPRLESFYGKTKFLIIYILSGVIGNLFSALFTDAISAGASGAIFGLFGALLYFGYHYRVYLDTLIRSRVIPIIIFNLFLSFTLAGIDAMAHLGGLIGGIFISMACGVKYKSSKSEIINGIITSIILFTFLFYMLLNR